MKNFLIRILLAAALTLVAFAMASSAQAQQADEDPALPILPANSSPRLLQNCPNSNRFPRPLRATRKLNRRLPSPAALLTSRVIWC